MTILGISGSLRRESYNTQLLLQVGELLPEGVELEIWDGLKAVPPFDEDDEAGAAPAVARMRDAIAGADAVLFATPEYNHSLPGQLKNALDWASRPKATSVLLNKRSQLSARARVPSGRSGRRPICARSSPRPARALSTARSRSGTPTNASTRAAGCSMRTCVISSARWSKPYSSRPRLA